VAVQYSYVIWRFAAVAATSHLFGWKQSLQTNTPRLASIKRGNVMGKGLIVAIALSAMASAAQAEPMKLTSNQMEDVTAGALVNLQLNLNVTTQVAIANAVGVCIRCRSLRVNSSAGNVNLSSLLNLR
jgi:hypothetical protein